MCPSSTLPRIPTTGRDSCTAVESRSQATASDARLSQFGRFGAGEPVGHRGGRLTWQLADADKLLVAWDEAARDYERRLLVAFAEQHDGRRPFANAHRLTGRRRASSHFKIMLRRAEISGRRPLFAGVLARLDHFKADVAKIRSGRSAPEKEEPPS
jgi:hypothetical protein